MQIVPITETPLSVAEVGVLWSFVHGDIMVGGIREQLRATLGPCPRHAWGYAAVEIELWQYGAGSRGGHQPFDVGVLYSDLLSDVTKQIEHRIGHSARRFRTALTPHGQCRVCMDLPTDRTSMRSIGYAGSNSEELTAEANRLEYTTEWCTQTLPMWADRVCPDCSNEPGDDVYLCRPHLLERGSVHADSPEAIVKRLRTLEAHFRRLVASMTQKGEPATGADDASWIETLGWFAGWSVPLTLAEAVGDTAERG